MNIESKYSAKGRFKARVIGSSGRVKSESEWSDNVVTNLGIRMLLGGATRAYSDIAVSIRCSCGSGNSAPSVNDTVIQSFIAGSNNITSSSTTFNTSTAPFYAKHEWKFLFDIGDAEGNVSELCIVNDDTEPTSSSPVFSRALVRDSAGNPTTITVLEDEYLEVTYELYIYPPAGELTGSFTQVIDGSPQVFTYSIKPSNMRVLGPVGVSDGWATNGDGRIPTVFALSGSRSSVYSAGSILGPENSVPSGTDYRLTGIATSSVANYAEKYRDLTFIASISDANTEFDAIRFAANLCCYQMKISPSITKNNTKTYRLNVRITLDNTA